MFFYFELLLAAIFYGLHLRVGFLFRSWRCWAILACSALLSLGAPLATGLLFGMGHAAPSPWPEIGLAIFPYPFIVLWIASLLTRPSGEAWAFLFISGLPLVQVLYYGAGCAIAAHLRKLPKFLLALFGVHGCAVALVFLLYYFRDS